MPESVIAEMELEQTIAVLRDAYRGFNARKMDAVLALMDRQVDWPNGMEGGRVQGHEGVRAYWTRQWGMVDPHVEPTAFEPGGEGDVVVTVDQKVRDLEGKLIDDRVVRHVYTMKDGLIFRMDIEE